MARGYVALVLHAHLPFVRHPEYQQCLEERWLFEAISECYLPLLGMLERLQADGVPFRLTVSLSPTLMAMLDDPLLRQRYQHYLEGCAELADREAVHTRGTPEEPLAHFYRGWYRDLSRQYLVRYRRDVAGAFHRFARAGYLDLITCAATHGFLPLLERTPGAVRAQVNIAAAAFQHRFGHPPLGFWLPECGYFPGVDRYLREAGIRYVFVESHAVADGGVAAPRGPYCHGFTAGRLAVFARDSESSRQVWSATEGYPGDPAYREFHRDIGFEREPHHLGRLAGADGVRTFTGFKYHRVTGPTEHKLLYDPQQAAHAAARHAAHFLRARRQQAIWLAAVLPPGPPPLVVAPYDAELFGHWWFEGPLFLEQLARQAMQAGGVNFVTPAEYLDRYPDGQGSVEPAYSSWGFQGYADFWCSGENHWIHRHVHAAGRRMAELACRIETPTATERRLLTQAARELLLAQASDWPFIIRAGTTVQYAEKRLRAHLGRFGHLADMLRGQQEPNLAWVHQVEAADNLFPHLDYSVFGRE